MKKALSPIVILLCMALLFTGCMNNESENFYHLKDTANPSKNTDLFASISELCLDTIEEPIKDYFINYSKKDNVYTLDFVVLTKDNKYLSYTVNVLDQNKDITSIVIIGLSGGLPSDMKNYVHKVCKQISKAEINNNNITIS